MPTLISILNGSDIKTFEAPPVFTEDERTTYFKLPQRAAEFAAKLRSPSSLAGFVLTLGYFRAANKFFDPNKFNSAVQAMEHEANRIIKDNDYYDILNSKSINCFIRSSSVLRKAKLRM